jgi:hypothetical protein
MKVLHQQGFTAMFSLVLLYRIFEELDIPEKAE